MRRNGDLPLFETKEAKGRIAFKLYAISMFVGICLIWVYRVTHVPRNGGRWAWMGMFGAEIWFGLYWIITQSARWKPLFRYTFKERLSERYESELPHVDIFVCTADPTIEPPTVVINTILSVMAYDYPPEKLSIYLSDDGGSDLTFYALFEAARFSRHWIPFCKKFEVEPRAPVAYFSEKSDTRETMFAEEWSAVKKFYEEMEYRIEAAVKLGRVSEEICKEHKGFSEWNSRITSRNHHTILQILIDGRDSSDLNTKGDQLPTLVYLAREKRPQYPHNFKAGAMNAMIRVSSEISNGQIILNVDCDMYSNNSKSVRDALCFFMDEEEGDEIAYVQFPQVSSNITKNDIYGNAFRIPNQVELRGLDGFGGPLYIGTGCFHRREILCGRKFSKASSIGEWKKRVPRKAEETICTLEQRAKNVANCTYEDNTQWGKEMGLKYGFPAEDVITGLSIQCRGWRSIFFSPERAAFLGLAPTSLEQALVQHKRWSEGNFQVFLKHCSFIRGRGKIKLGLQMAYCIFGLWAPNSFPTLYYVFVPSLCFLNGVSMFPMISSLWFIPFSCVIMAKYTYSLGESLWAGDTLKGWWNDQRSWMMRRTTSYLFGFVDAILNNLGLAKLAFTITAKVADDEVNKRYEEEIMEFGSSSPMFIILATIGLFNLLCFVGGVQKVVMGSKSMVVGPLALQFLLCGLLVFTNIPIYQGLFFRKDKGKMPTSITFTSLVIALLVCLIPMN